MPSGTDRQAVDTGTDVTAQGGATPEPAGTDTATPAATPTDTASPTATPEATATPAPAAI
jgi:hypothetical protein